MLPTLESRRGRVRLTERGGRDNETLTEVTSELRLECLAALELLFPALWLLELLFFTGASGGGVVGAGFNPY